jgi:hypothetical protein
MEPPLDKRAREMVEMLRAAGMNCGLLVQQGVVVLRRPGSPYSDTPTKYDETDLKNAIALNLIEERTVSGTLDWHWYCAR